MKPKSPAEVRLMVCTHLKSLGHTRVKAFRSSVFWITTVQNLERINWFYLETVSGSHDQALKFRNIVLEAPPKTFWKRGMPSPVVGFHTFDINIHQTEATPEFIEKLVSFVEFMSQKKDGPFEWPLFEGQSFPSYGISEAAAQIWKK